MDALKSLVPKCDFPPHVNKAFVGWNLLTELNRLLSEETSDQTLILKFLSDDRLQSEHLSLAVFFQVRSETQSWFSLSALHTDVHSELCPNAQLDSG